MNHKDSNNSFEFNNYGTPNGTPSSSPVASRTALEHHTEYTGGAHPSNAPVTSAEPSEAPAYSEHAFSPQPAARGLRNGLDSADHPSGITEEPTGPVNAGYAGYAGYTGENPSAAAANPAATSNFGATHGSFGNTEPPNAGGETAGGETAGETASVTPTVASSRRRIAASIKSYFHRNSQSSSRRDPESNPEGSAGGDGAHKEGENPEESPEELAKKAEDPQYLLNTIMEEPEDGQDLLVPVGDAAAIVTADSSSSIANQPTGMSERRKGYKENLMRARRLRRYTRASKTVSTMRRWFNQFIGFSLFTRMFVYWLPLAIILFVPLAVGAWRNPNMKLGSTRVMWIFIWLEVVWGTLFFSRLISHYLPYAFGFLISIFSPKYFKYVNMVSALELAIQLVIWTFISFITFSPLLYNNKNALDLNHQPRWQKIIQDICVAFLVSSCVFFVEQAFLYILSTNFHRTRMALRIQKQKKSINVLIILLDAAFKFFPWHCDEFDEEDSGLQYASLNKARKTTSKSKNMVMRKVNKVVGTATKNVENIISSAKLDDTNPTPAKIVNRALTHRDTREILANRIWKSLVMEDSTALNYEDLITVFGNERKEEVLFIFDVLDQDGVNGIDLDEMVDSVNSIGRESKQIQKSLVDIDGAITKLHYLLMCIALILIVVIFVGMLAPSSATVLATLGSTLLSMSFLFSATAQEVFQSCIFLFVKHPYDAGDWIQTYVSGPGLIRMRAVELNLMYSVFEEIGNNTRRQVSNSVLNTMFIDNISRSPPSQISIVLNIGIPETTTEQLAEFETRLNEFCDSNPREYYPGVFFQAINQPDLDRLALNICINTRNNQDDIVLFSTRRTKAFEYISQCINDIPITIPKREDTTNHDPSLPMFHYMVKDIDDASKFVERSKNRRQNYGMRPPLEEDDLSIKYHDEPINTAGYQDGPAPHPNTSAHPDPASQGGSLRRATSFSSKMSRHSMAFSSASKTSVNFGMRSRRRPMQQYKPAQNTSDDHTN